MAPRISLAALCILVVAAAGCGSSSSSSSSPSTTAGGGATSTASTATQPTGTGPDHFTAAQWSKYQADAAAFKTLNTKTLARVAACSKPVQTGAHPNSIKVCVGTSLDMLFAATTQLGRDLASFTGTVGGDCETALNSLIGYVVPYQASIKSLQSAVDSGNQTTSYASVANLQTARAAGQQSEAAVATSCAP